MLRALLVTLALTGTLLQGALDDTQNVWFFALEQDTNLVIAYNVEGARVPLVQGGALTARGRWRIDNQSLLVQFEAAPDDFPIYLLHPDGATLLPYTFTEAMQVVAYHEPYAVMMPVAPSIGVKPSVLLNLEAATATLLSAETAPPIEAFPCCRFAPDGTLLRYISRTTPDADQPRSGEYQLRERNLETGEERLILTTPREDEDTGEQISTWQPDVDGDRWIASVSAPAPEGADRARIPRSWLVPLDGDVEILTDPDDDTPPVYRFWDDNILVINPFCEADCIMQVLDSEREVRLSFPATADTTLARPHYLGSDYMIATAGQEHLRLSEAAAPEVIGYFSPRYMAGEFASPDGRWLAMVDAVDEPQAVLIYDAVEDTVVLTHEITGFPVVTFRGHWLILMDNAGRTNTWDIVDLNAGDVARFTSEANILAEVLSLEQIIVSHVYDDDGAGLLLHSIDDEKSVSLVAGRYQPLSGPDIADAVLR